MLMTILFLLPMHAHNHMENKGKTKDTIFYTRVNLLDPVISSQGSITPSRAGTQFTVYREMCNVST